MVDVFSNILEGQYLLYIQCRSVPSTVSMAHLAEIDKKKMLKFLCSQERPCMWEMWTYGSFQKVLEQKESSDLSLEPLLRSFFLFLYESTFLLLTSCLAFLVLGQDSELGNHWPRVTLEITGCPALCLLLPRPFPS